MLMVENIIREYGLWAVFLGALVEGELTLLFAGVLAHYGLFSFSEVFLSGTFGGVIGDSICYLVGYTGKCTIRQSALIQRAQPRLEKMCQRFGIWSIFLVKYIYGFRIASAVFWGFAQMKFRRFAPLTTASCMVWVGLLSGIGYFFSEAIELIIGRVQRIGVMLLIALLITALVAIFVYLIEKHWLVNKIPELGILGLREPKKGIEAEVIPLRSRPKNYHNNSQAA